MQLPARRGLFLLLIAGGLSAAFVAHRSVSSGQSLSSVAGSTASQPPPAAATISTASPHPSTARCDALVAHALSEKGQRDGAHRQLPALVLTWAETDPTAFSTYLRTHPERAPLLVETLASSAAASRPVSALSDLMSRLTPVHQDVFASVAARTLTSRRDAQTAADWMALPAIFPASALAVDYVAGELASNHPELLDAWLVRLPVHPNATNAYAGAYRQLAADSPDRAMDALVVLSGKPGLNPAHVSAATRGVIEIIATDEPDLAADLARRLTNAKDRALALQHTQAHARDTSTPP